MNKIINKKKQNCNAIFLSIRGRKNVALIAEFQSFENWTQKS